METCKLRGIMEDYKKKYEDALERAKVINPGTADYEVAVKIFPELKESEDERIRKSLIKSYTNQHPANFPTVDGFTREQILAWLEKQGEQIDIANKEYWRGYREGKQEIIDKYFDLEKEGKQKPAESKFKIGDWINKDGAIWRIEGVSGKEYILGGRPDVIMQEPIHIIESEFHLWTIQDARDGDVLCYRNDIFLVKSYVLFNKVVSHCTYSKRFIPHNIYSFTREDFNKIYPATKEQRDLLFQKMKEAGYEWDDEKKELRQKSAKWSEKDEKISKAIYQSIDYPCLESFGVSEDEVYDWFKSLKTYYHWKPNDEQMNSLKQWLNEHRYDGNSRYIYAIINSLYEQLKSL